MTLATFMEVLDTSIANVSLPHIAGNLSAGVDESTWVLTSYLVANAIILPLSRLVCLRHRPQELLHGFPSRIFTVSSMLSGLAPSLFWLVVFRIMQGWAAEDFSPANRPSWPIRSRAEKLGMGMALYGVAVVTAPIIGPDARRLDHRQLQLALDLLHQYPRWHLYPIYLTSNDRRRPAAPSAAQRDETAARLHRPGAVALGIGALQLMLDKGQREDWFASHLSSRSPSSRSSALFFAVLWEIRQNDPMIDFRLLGDRNFGVACVLMFMLGFILFGSTVLLPLFLQTLMGYSATTAGMVLSPGGLVTMLCMPLVGFLLSRVEARWLIVFGMSIAASPFSK